MRVTFDHSKDIADHIKTFSFKPQRKVRYTAGQFIELTLPHEHPDERGIKHWFTLSSSSTEDYLSITTKLAAERVSTFKKVLFALKPGEEVSMSDPMGDFVLPKDKTIPLVFIAGGIGVTPMRSMVKWLLDTQEKRDIKMLYAANSLEEVAFRDLFTTYGLTMNIILSNPPPNWSGESGRLTAQKTLELAPADRRTLYFISGPELMVEALNKDLQTAGIPERRLVSDYFPNYTKI